MLKGTESGLLIQIKDIEKDIKELELKLRSKMFITRIDFFIYPKDKEHFDRLEKLLKSFGFKLFIAEERANRTIIRMQEKQERLEAVKKVKESIEKPIIGIEQEIHSEVVNQKIIIEEASSTLEVSQNETVIPTIVAEVAVPEVSMVKSDETFEHNDLFSYFSNLETLVIQKTLRSGQRVEHSGNVVIVGDINSGAEVFADGDIFVFGRVLGTVHAGRTGNMNSVILGLSIESQRVRIGSEFLEIKRTSKTTFSQYEKVSIDKNGSVVIEEIGKIER